MLSRNFFGVMAAAFTAFVSVVHCDITAQEGFVPKLHRDTSVFALYVVGDKNDYRISPLHNGNEEVSNATCGHYVKDSEGLGPNGEAYYTGQCQIDASQWEQVFELDCLNRKDPHKLSKGKGHATITFTNPFYFDPEERSFIKVVSENNIWVGFNSSFLVEQPKKLKKAPQPSVKFGGNDASVFLNCHSDKIAPVTP